MIPRATSSQCVPVSLVVMDGEQRHVAGLATTSFLHVWFHSHRSMKINEK